MTDIRREDEERIRLYLAGRLTEAESDMVRTRMVQDDIFRSEVELTQALRDGLRELQSRGEIAPLLSPRHTLWSQSRGFLAAAAALLAIGLASFLFFSRQDAGEPEAAHAMLRFESTRGGESGADLVWQRNAGISRLELRFDVGLEPAPSYRVQITGPGEVLAERVAAVAPDGMAVLLLDVDDVPAGDYRFLLQPQPASPAAAVSYTLRVTDGS